MRFYSNIYLQILDYYTSYLQRNSEKKGPSLRNYLH